MPRAIWKGAVIAESDKYETVEGNVYFPPDTLHTEYFRASDKHTTCPWKGTASYFDVVVGGQVNKDAGWYYPQPSSAADSIKGYVAFWNGVTIEK